MNTKPFIYDRKNKIYIPSRTIYGFYDAISINFKIGETLLNESSEIDVYTIKPQYNPANDCIDMVKDKFITSFDKNFIDAELGKNLSEAMYLLRSDIQKMSDLLHLKTLQSLDVVNSKVKTYLIIPINMLYNIIGYLRMNAKHIAAIKSIMDSPDWTYSYLQKSNVSLRDFIIDKETGNVWMEISSIYSDIYDRICEEYFYKNIIQFISSRSIEYNEKKCYENFILDFSSDVKNPYIDSTTGLPSFFAYIGKSKFNDIIFKSEIKSFEFLTYKNIYINGRKPEKVKYKYNKKECTYSLTVYYKK